MADKWGKEKGKYREEKDGPLDSVGCSDIALAGESVMLHLSMANNSNACKMILKDCSRVGMGIIKLVGCKERKCRVLSGM